MIDVKCQRCQQPLTEPGGLAFGPPFESDGFDACEKVHICVTCWQIFLNWIAGGKQ